MLPTEARSLRKATLQRTGLRRVAPRSREVETAKDVGLSKTVAFLAECPGSASIDEQKGHLDPDDHIIVAGKRSFNKLPDLLAHHGLALQPGDRVRVFDLSCINLSTTTLVRSLTKLLAGGVAVEIMSLGIMICPGADDRLHAMLDALDSHYRYVHGIKTHPADAAPQGRKRLLKPDQLPDIRSRLDRPGATATGVAQELGVARATLFNYLDRYDRSRRLGRSKKVGDLDTERTGDRAHVVQRKAGETSS